jgi:hypothetical protein
LELRQLPYIVVARMTKWVKRAAQGCATQKWTGSEFLFLGLITERICYARL